MNQQDLFQTPYLQAKRISSNKHYIIIWRGQKLYWPTEILEKPKALWMLHTYTFQSNLEGCWNLMMQEKYMLNMSLWSKIWISKWDSKFDFLLDYDSQAAKLHKLANQTYFQLIFHPTSNLQILANFCTSNYFDFFILMQLWLNSTYTYPNCSIML